MNNDYLSALCTFDADTIFGPQVNGCRQNFDFTLLFEEAILSVPISSIFLLLLVPRLLRLRERNLKARRDFTYYGKLVLLGILVLTQTVFLTLNSVSDLRTKATLGASALSLVASVSLVPLSILEHTRTVRPSNLVIVYLSMSLTCDLPRARTLFLLEVDFLASAVTLTITLGIRALLIVWESYPKVDLLIEGFREVAPEESSGIVGRSLFLWLNSLLRRGYQGILSMENLLRIDAALRCQDDGPPTLNKVFQQVSRGKVKPQLTLLIACVKYGIWTLAAGVLPRALQIGFTMAQPFLVHATVNYVEHANKGDPVVSLNGYGLISAFALVYIGIAISTPAATHQAYRFSTILRAQLIDMIYAKTMLIHSSDIEESAPLTLMSADLERISSGLRYIHDLWGCIIEIGFALWLLWLQLGIAAIAPIVVAIICILAAIRISALAGPRQELWLKAIEKRVDATAKFLGAMKTVKMTGLEQKMSNLLQDLRANEIVKSEKYRRLLIIVVGFAYTNISISPVISFAIWALIDRSNGGEGLTSSQAFTSLTLFTLLATPISILVEASAGVATAIGSIERINTFLHTASRQDERAPPPGQSTTSLSGSFETDISSIRSDVTKSISMARLSSDFIEDKGALRSAVLLADNLTAGWSDKHSVTAGPLSITINPCTLTIIVGPVGSGKSTIINSLLGETRVHDGTLLVANRRIAYCSQTSWLTNSTIQSNILGNSLYDMKWYDTVIKSCALDRDIRDMPMGDQTIVGTQGAVLSGGQKQRVALARAVYSKLGTIVLDDALSGLDSSTSNEIFNALFVPEGLLRQNGVTIIMTTNDIQRLPFADYVVVMNEEGKIAEQGTWQELKEQGSKIQDFVNKTSTNSPRCETRHVAQEMPLSDPFLEADGVPASRQYGDTKIYFYYARVIGIWRSLIFMILLIFYVFFVSFPGIWVQRWAKAEHPNHNLGYWLGIYACLGIMAVFFIISSCWHLMCNMVAVVARSLHMILLETVQNAPVSFFSTTDIGRTTNRFSQDLQLVDMELPLSVLNTSLSALTCLAQLIIVCISTTYIAAVVPALIVAFYFIQGFYLRTSRQLRYMEIEAKAPLFTHFIATLSGISTIRSFGWEEQYQSKSRTLTNNSQVPLYLLFSLQRWLELVVGLTVAGFAVVLVGVMVAVTKMNALDAGFVGLALLNLVTLSENLQALIIQWTVLETSLGAVARIKDFAESTVSENTDSENGVPPEKWPQQGAVEFKDVTASYTEDRPVLNKISFTFNAGQKIAICGRTGSGKSSLVSTLLRTVDIDSGSIIIDGQDISALPRSFVRSSLNVITQEPFFFPGTLRQNLDPSGSLPDKKLIRSLRKVRRWDEIKSLGGLDVQITQDLFSPGAKQLLSIARVLCSSTGKLLVFDEATSSIDHETELQIRQLVAKHFSKHTVVEVTHRLESILDFDMVVLMDKGSVIECGQPRELLARGQESAFAHLYNDLKST